MLLIGIDSWGHLIWVSLASLCAILVFSAATMNWFVTKSRLWESAVLLLVCFTLFRPDWWLNQFSPPYEEIPPSTFMQTVAEAPAGARLSFVVEGINLMGDTVRKTVNVPLGEPAEATERLRAIGLGVAPLGDTVTINNVAFGSYAKRIGLDVGFEVVGVMRKAEQPSPLIPIALALLLTLAIAGIQYARLRQTEARHHPRPQSQPSTR
jgi:hypothetical protein